MVDKNGKLFGKVNLIDLLIVLVLLALAAFVAFKVFAPDDSGAELSQVRVSFFGEEVPDYVIDVLEEGTPVLDSKENVTMGTVESFETSAPIGYETDTLGEIQAVTRSGHHALSITATARGVVGDHGVTIDGMLYGVGHTLTIYAGKAKLYLKISAIEPVA